MLGTVLASCHTPCTGTPEPPGASSYSWDDIIVTSLSLYYIQKPLLYIYREAQEGIFRKVQKFMPRLNRISPLRSFDVEDDLGTRRSPILAASSGWIGLEGEGMQKTLIAIRIYVCKRGLL